MVQHKSVSEKVITAPSITVKPGDFGKRFQLLDEGDGNFNRPIHPDRVSVMVRQWTVDEAEQSVVRLWQVGDDQYKILDGQHRIFTVSEYLGRAFTFPAIVHPYEEFAGKPEKLRYVLKACYGGVAQSNNDRLLATSLQSKWPAIFAEYGLTPTYSGKFGEYNWNAIISGRLRADASHRTESINGMIDGVSRGSRKDRDLIERAWLNYPEEKIRETAAILKWWHPAADHAYRRAERVNVLFSAPGVQAALLIWECNISNPALSRVPAKLMGDPRLVSLKGHSNVRRIVKMLLNFANQRQISHLLSIYDETGRD